MTAAAVSNPAHSSAAILTPIDVEPSAPVTPSNVVINAAFLADDTLTLNEKARTLSQRLRETPWPVHNRQVELLINDLDDFDEASEQYGDLMHPWYTPTLDYDTMIMQLNEQAKQDQVWLATVA